MFTVENLCASYNGKKVFENVSFSLEEKSITALCGLNGSGKSTLLSLMSGISNPSMSVSGKVFLDGSDVLRQKAKVTARRISYLVQDEHSVWNISVKNLIDGGRFVHRKWFEESTEEDERIISEAMEMLSLTELKDRPISTLSGGEYQRARIARSFVQQTDYIFLDEPLSSVDITYQNGLMNILRDLCGKGKTVCISIHDINLASQFADSMIFMKKDRSGIITGTASDMMTEQTLMQTYGKNFRIFNHPVTGKKQIW